MVEIKVGKAVKGVPYAIPVKLKLREEVPKNLKTKTGIMFPKGSRKYYELNSKLAEYLVKRFNEINYRD